MACAKSTMAHVDSEDNADLDAVDVSAHDDAAETSSTFDQDIGEDAPLGGRGDHGSFDTEHEGDNDDEEDDHEASDDEDADPEVVSGRNTMEVVAVAAGHTFYFSPSTITEDRIHELEKLKYFADGDGRALGKKTVLEPEWDEAVVFEG
jgi:hypothetical protein